MNICKNFSAVCRMIKIEHSVFALPFAWSGALLAGREVPGLKPLLLLTVAMVAIRSFAMAFNRLADMEHDARNPRTKNRPLVTGEITPWQTWRFCGVTALLFIFSCALLNEACLALSLPALGLAALYSYTKRFTWTCHFFLGAVIGLAPVAGFLAITPEFSLPALLMGAAVLFWIAGFDILYACQDRDYDTEAGLHSVPVRFGLAGAMTVAAFCHVNTMLLLLLSGLGFNLGWGWYLCLAVTGAILWWEHSIVSPDRLENLRTAFAVNGPISLLLLLGVALGLWM